MAVKVEVEQVKKRGPKPRYGKDRPCVNRSLSIPDVLWDWCCEQALLSVDPSVSAFIVELIKKEKRRLSK